MKTRIYPEDQPEKWEAFKEYCIQDVIAEREIGERLSKYTIPESERTLYFLDQKINDTGILIDLDFAKNASQIDDLFSAELLTQLKQITGLDNPNSPAQLKKWLGDQTGKSVGSLAKGEIPALLEGCESPEVKRVLELRQMGSKTSTKKYIAMLNCACEDNRAHGLFQFYGANRTGRCTKISQAFYHN